MDGWMVGGKNEVCRVLSLPNTKEQISDAGSTPLITLHLKYIIQLQYSFGISLKLGDKSEMESFLLPPPPLYPASGDASCQ